ncbi:hemerythrin domain-containing protein [Ramlibacter sp. Leaf400]|uniref:hemerythrin domain-containing protein n=1 Tax=Ramlibacter sp. Leaf400 TaxID=1736365 RepID=UPI0006F85E26|nr:hemerythrin domain-containing protein [Ramlibacter sp. Leaf400]KQT14109.1 hypothetical protein ASG30_00540 [Ramlibacter sp. Leaf400]
MKIDAQELERLAAPQPRMDMYSGIHKALRACMADALLALGRLDADDAQDVAAASRRVLDLLDICASHLQHENDFVHRAIEARAAGASAAVAHDHDEHGEHIGHLRSLTQALQGSAPGGRAVLAQQLYRQVALFTAENFRHMNVEETAHNAVLWARYTDAELAAVHDALVASIPPEKMMQIARWMLPALNPAERLAVLSDIRGKAPAPAFEAMLEVARPHLTAGEWAKLARGLGLPPVPRLVAA